ncbi:hypothetical protein CPB83DRAFT_842299 [Crepidotus variabilis]|uniref:SPRY-domain-containing protein n=1 Tax=Crepidotus variabilis TaxID=179855 RepID=A0A9P6EVJ4_9AGAR|nr:hypothetical protein CPB83DRAFT_842299 [Crepidotus variabilis]
MNTRPSRSSSIPIPRSASASSSARNLESLISIPLIPPGRGQPRSPSTTRPIPEPRRVSVADGSRTAASTSHGHGPPTSPIRSSARSPSVVSSVPRRSPSNTRFEPRVVRSTATDGEGECPPQSSTSPTVTRRASLASVRAAASQRPVIPHHVVARAQTTSFPRPSYLDNSSLRHMLHTEIPIAPIPSRRADPTASARNQAYANAMIVENEDDGSPAASPSIMPPLKTSFKLPTRWSDQDRHPSLNVSPEGRELMHQGQTASGDKDAASARTTHPIPPACGIFYYEVDILGKEQKSKISIGFSGKTARFAKLPGQEPHSWAYYGDDGTALSPDRTGIPFRQPFGTSDIIGCGIDFTTYKVFFTRNGVLIGQVFDNVGKDMPIFPSIGFQQSGDSVRTNFGQEPFKFDIEYHVQQQKVVVWNQIQATPLHRTILRGHPKTGLGSIASITNDMGDQPPLNEDESKTAIDQLVLSYLVHHGYAKTARSFEKQCHSLEIKDIETSTLDGDDDDVDMTNGASKADGADVDIETRKTIVNLVIAGKIDDAIDTLRICYAPVLEADKQLIWFKLRFRKFVELILVTTELKKQMKAIREKEKQQRKMSLVPPLPTHNHWMEDDMGMDIDEDVVGPIPMSNRPSSNRSDSSGSGREKNLSPELQEVNLRYEDALTMAITYGQSLSNDFHSDSRPELQQLFKRTFGIVAWEDPLEEMADIAGHHSRVALANEVNQAILKSQGRPARPPLETLYRHAATSITQLGLMGVGSAVFTEMPHESIH